MDNPRYERANIVFNSKTVVQNFDPNQPRVLKGNPNGGQFTKNTVDLTNYFTSTPTMKEVKEFLNKMVEEGKEFATSSPDWLIDIPQSSKKRKHIAYSSQYKFMSNTEKRRHNKYVLALEDLLKNAEYLNEKSNTKPLEKPNTEKYHYFGSNVRIGKKVYKIIFDTEEFKGDSTIKPQTVHLYDVQEVKNSSSGANDLMSVKNPKEESNTIITDNREDFNPMFKNNEIQNWNEEDHPRDEAGKFTGKKGTSITKSRKLLLEADTNAEYKIKSKDDWIEFTIEKAKILGERPIMGSSRILRKEDLEELDDIKIQKLKNLYSKYNILNNKEQDMALLDELKKLITKVENNKEQEMTEKIENEKVDKRDIIRQIMAIAGKHEDNEDVRTIAKLAEKLAYDKSEAGTADNVCDDEEEEVKNKKVKNEETGKDKDFINRELNKGNLLYKKTGVSNREASIASKVDILPNNIITDIQEDFNPMIMGAYISNIIKIIPVVILNLFLKK